jgi:DNA-binding CsgD family transcriptional regulator
MLATLTRVDADRPTVTTVGSLVARRVGASPASVTTVVAFGGSVALCAEAVSAACRDGGMTCALVWATRRPTPDALRTRIGAEAGAAEVVVLGEAQWADAASLDTLAAAVAGGEIGHAVVVRRSGSVVGDAAHALAALQLTPGATVVQVLPLEVGDVMATGATAVEAAQLMELTDGHADLIAAQRDGTLDHEVLARVSLVDDHVRAAAELVAFGVGLPRAAATTSDDEATANTLRVEGLIDGERMPAAVATVIRGSATPGRRERLVTLAADVASADELQSLGQRLLDAGDRSQPALRLFHELAAAAAVTDPPAALRFVDAMGAVTPLDRDLRVVEARAALACGVPHRAVRALDELGTDADLEMLRAAAWVAVGDLDTAAGCLGRSTDPALAGWATAGIGAPGAANDAAGTDAGATLSTAVRSWIDGDVERAMQLGATATRRSRGSTTCEHWPVSPEETVARIAQRCGLVAEADAVVNEALTAGTATPWRDGGMRQLRAWMAARRGYLDQAVQEVEQARSLTPYDETVRAATRCAAAVRDGLGTDLDDVAAAGRAALRSCGTNLYDLDMVADIAGAVQRSRTGSGSDVLHAVADAAARSGSPLMAFDVAWARLCVALVGDDLEAIAIGAERLASIADAPDQPYVAARAEAATLLASPSGEIDSTRALDVARRLAGHGAVHEAARLCGVLALRSVNEVTTRTLLRESRNWRSQRAVLRQGGLERSVATLSEQEEAVARLVLDGHTHKQVGAALFISPKTVEHHVAHIRTKLGAADRAEMMAAIRSYLDSASSAS